MSIIRPWTNGDQVALDNGRVPVFQDEKDVWLFDAAGNPILLNARGNLEVEIASQITPAFILSFSTPVDGEETLTSDISIDDKIISVSSVAGVSINDHIVLTDDTNSSLYVGTILAINTLDITVDSPVSNIFTVANTVVTYTNIGMNVNGSITPVVFSIRTGESTVAPLTDIIIDITRILLTMVLASAADLTLFGDLTVLTNGCVLRVKNSDGTYHNILNVKTNKDLVKMAFDLSIEAATNPSQGIDGLAWRLTFGGEEKIGTVIRLDHQSDLEWVIQDDLTAITVFESVGEGALVAD